MEGPRAPLQTEWKDLMSFLDKNLRAENSWSVASEYPTTFTDENLRNIRVIYNEGKILSHAAWKPLMIKTPQAVYKFACIGSVVTSEESRNQGLSQRILEDCLASAEKEDCDFAILWTNLYDFYRRLGFELAGSEVTYLIDRQPEAASSQYRIQEGNKVDPQAILRVSSKHTVSTVRTAKEVKKYLEIPNSRVYTAWEKDGSLAAYAVEGKGADLQSYVHEWGGSVPALLSLLAHIQKSQARDLHWMIPQHSQNLSMELNRQGFRSHHGFLGMLKLLNPTRFCMKLERYLRMSLKDPKIQVRYHNGKVNLSGMGVEISLTETELTEFAFGPKVPKALTQMTEGEYERVNSVLPMPLWVWGWDSI